MSLKSPIALPGGPAELASAQEHYLGQWLASRPGRARLAAALDLALIRMRCSERRFEAPIALQFGSTSQPTVLVDGQLSESGLEQLNRLVQYSILRRAEHAVLISARIPAHIVRLLRFLNRNAGCEGARRYYCLQANCRFGSQQDLACELIALLRP